MPIARGGSILLPAYAVRFLIQGSKMLPLLWQAIRS